ncbi:MAG: hypothetical protein AAF548_03240 [Actinomycetota bacterium]
MTCRALAAVVAVTVLAAACGGGGDDTEAGDEPGFVLQDEGSVDLDSATTTTEAADDTASAGASEGDGQPTFDETSDTIPTDEEEDAGVGNLFVALSSFTSCLEVEGYEFIGQPSQDREPTDPVNDPGYIEALSTCAATSNIAQAFQEFQTASDNLSPEEIEERNRQLVFWIDCMEGRGWIIGEPSVDAKGLQQPTDLTPPDGESVLGSDDLQECAGVAGDAYEESLEGES